MANAGRPELTLIQGGGASNSRLTANNCSPGGAGFDTIRLRYRDQDGAYDRARAAGAAVHARGELRSTVAGVTVGSYPDGLVTVEGRLAAILNGEEDHRLLDSEALKRAPEAAAELFDLDPTRPVEVGRADLASELHFADTSEGRELLRSASYVDLPWLKVGTEGESRQRLESVTWRAMRGRSIVLRLYDKGVETGQGEPGQWLRMERQRRWRKTRAQTVAAVTAGDLRELFVGRELLRLVHGVDDVHVCDRDGAVQRLRELHAAGRLSGRALQGVVAFVVLDGEGLKPRMAYYRARQLRDLGIALNPNEGGRSTFPAGRLLSRFAEPWAA